MRYDQQIVLLIPSCLGLAVGFAVLVQLRCTNLRMTTETQHIRNTNHCDACYADKTQLTHRETLNSLDGLLTSFAEFMEVNRFEFWIAHGTLLGWHWNQKHLPWDTDIDVQVSGPILMALARKFNDSTYPDPPER